MLAPPNHPRGTTVQDVDEVLREATQVKNIWVPYGA